MHKFMRAIGFSKLTDRREQQKLITDIIVNAARRSYTSNGEETILAEFCEDFAEDLGIAVCGEFDSEDKFTYDYFYPYLRGTGISSYEDVSVERHAEKESYAGICDDIKVGVSLIFYLQNIVPYVKAQHSDMLPIRGTSLTLSGLSISGNIILPIGKNEKQKQKIQKASINRNQLLAAARKGDEEAIESLTLEDIDLYSSISKRAKVEDIYSIVDSSIIPYGVNSEQYSIMGTIQEYRQLENPVTKELLYKILVNANGIYIDIMIHSADLLGEPAVGRRFKGTVWVQGYVYLP